MIKPVFARVVIRRDSIKEKAKSSLIIPPDAAKRNAPATGMVLAVGPNVAKEIQPGQHVVFGQHAGTYIDHEGTEYFVCNDEDIICEIEHERERKAA